MTREESMQLFRYFNKEFAKINKQLEATASKQQLDTVFVILDGMKGSLATLTTEYHALSAQTTRHEHWITKASRKLGLPYRT